MVSSRRKAIGSLLGFPIFNSISGIISPDHIDKINRESKLPAQKLFDIKGTYLNSAYTHPMSLGSKQLVGAYLNSRMENGKKPLYIMDENRKLAKKLFAELIQADEDEIAWIPSTMAGENLILNGLSIKETKSRLVTDAYHFSGSLFMYTELAKKGVDVQIIQPKENRINYDDIEKALIPGTKLIAVSLVSAFNGFQHDLKKLCDMAHARNILVYADIIQAAGAVPINVKESGVDFCACASYKWLMGDFGAGFLYVRKDKMDLLNKTQYGYRQEEKFTTHIFPFDEPGQMPFESESKKDAGGNFEVGTLANGAIPALRFSLEYILNTGTEKIQNHRQSMISLLQQKLPGLGFLPLTPIDSISPIVSFAYKNAYDKFNSKLIQAGINISMYKNRIRVSPSVFNGLEDVEKLVDALM
jgi:selenocysteine lyase/cysteine desulfurase